MEDAADGRDCSGADLAVDPPSQGILADGRRVTIELFRALLQNELARLAAHVERRRMRRGTSARPQAFLDEMTSAASCADFLTLAAYPQLQ